MLTDTHAHLDFPEFTEDFGKVLDRAQAAGVTRIITIGTTLEASRRAVELAEQYSNVFATVGIHPSNAEEVGEDFTSVLRELAQSPRVVALGEIGLDYHRLPSGHLLGSKDGILSEAPLSDPPPPSLPVGPALIAATVPTTTRSCRV